MFLTKRVRISSIGTATWLHSDRVSKLISGLSSTVKLGYNDHGYNEITAIANKLEHPILARK